MVCLAAHFVKQGMPAGMAKRAKSGSFIVDKGADLAITGGVGGLTLIATVWGAIREHVPLVAIPSAGAAAFGISIVFVALAIRAMRWVYPGTWVDPDEHQRIKNELEQARHDNKGIALARKTFCDHADKIQNIDHGPAMNKWMTGAAQLVASTIRPDVVPFQIFRTDQGGRLNNTEKEPLEAVAARLRGIAINLRPEHLLHSHAVVAPLPQVVAESREKASAKPSGRHRQKTAIIANLISDGLALLDTLPKRSIDPEFSPWHQRVEDWHVDGDKQLEAALTQEELAFLKSFPWNQVKHYHNDQQINHACNALAFRIAAMRQSLERCGA